MGFTKYILPALAVAGTAFAQCDGPSITITSQSDASSIQNCQTYSGDVIISENASGTIAVNGVQQITGDLTCNNATQLTALTSDQLNSIGGTFGLNGLTILSTLQFSSLTSVNNINWVSLPALQGLNFNQGVQKANNVLISNTQLNTLSGIELMTVGSLDINNNPYLNTVNVNGLTNVTNTLSFAANSKDLQISFPNLQNAANMTFRNVSAITMPSLSSVQGSMGFYSDTFETFSAPNLTATGGTLAFVDSPNLSNVSFPILTQIGGGFLIANNSNLLNIDGFPKLSVIVGALDFAGAFQNISVPSLHDVRGGSNVQTSSTNDVCGEFNADSANGVIKGVNTCIYGKSNPATNPSATSGGTTSSSTASAKSDASLFDPSAPLTGLSAIIAALLMI